MSNDERANQVDALGHYWDEVVNGASSLPTDLDRGLGATVHRFAALGGVPVPEPEFGRRLWEELMNQARTIPPVRPVPIPGLTALPNGRHAGDLVRLRFDRLRPRRWWTRIESMAALLLVIVLAAGAVALGGTAPRRNVGGNVAHDATPTPDRASWFFGGGGGGPVPLPAGDGPLQIALRELTLQPGAAWDAPANVYLDLCILTGLVTLRDRSTPPQESRFGGNSCVSTENLTSLVNDHTAPAVVLQLALGASIPSSVPSAGVTIEELGAHACERPTSDQAYIGLERIPVTETDGSTPEPRGGPATTSSGRPLSDEAVVFVGVESGSVEVSNVAAELRVQRAGDDASVAATPISGGASIPLAVGDAVVLRPVVGGDEFA